MRTVTGITGIAAVQELASRLSDPEVDGLTVEVGHTSAGEFIVILTDRDFVVLMTVGQVQATLAGIAQAAESHPSLNTDPAIRLLATGLVEAIHHVKQRTLH